MIFGYARVSKQEQNPDMQLDALKEAGCDEIVWEKLSGRKPKKQKLDALLEKLRKDDILVVYSVGRLGRTSRELINLLFDLKERGIQFKSLKEGVFDTTTPMGEAIFQIVAILKGMEVEVLRERTRDGLESARARGRKGGRPKGSYNKNKAAAAVTLYQRKLPITEITQTLSISRSTLYEYLRKEGVK